MILPGFPRPLAMVGGGGLPPGTTWNPADKAAGITLSNGNLTTVGNDDSAYEAVRATASVAEGKVYWEIAINGQIDSAVGIGDASVVLDRLVGSAPFVPNNSLGYARNGQVRYKNSALYNGSTWTAGDVLGVALDMDGLMIFFSKNGSWQNSANPAAGTGGWSFDAGVYFPMASGRYAADSVTANFNGPFTYAVPSGFN